MFVFKISCFVDTKRTGRITDMLSKVKKNSKGSVLLRYEQWSLVQAADSISMMMLIVEMLMGYEMYKGSLPTFHTGGSTV